MYFTQKLKNFLLSRIIKNQFGLISLFFEYFFLNKLDQTIHKTCPSTKCVQYILVFSSLAKSRYTNASQKDNHLNLVGTINYFLSFATHSKYINKIE
jgi:hypothetical protein